VGVVAAYAFWVFSIRLFVERKLVTRLRLAIPAHALSKPKGKKKSSKLKRAQSSTKPSDKREQERSLDNVNVLGVDRRACPYIVKEHLEIMNEFDLTGPGPDFYVNQFWFAIELMFAGR
jgi:hypothetical protein